jgi:hypothetical protein
VFDLFKNLPKKNSIYTVRSVKSGRSNPQFVVDDDAVVLEVLEGPDRGLQAVVVKGAWVAPGDSFALTFTEGAAVISSADSSVLVLNGKRTASEIVPLLGDVIESPAGHRLEVEG